MENRGQLDDRIDDGDRIEKLVRSFYSSYMEEVATSADNEKLEILREMFMTGELQSRLYDIGDDEILPADPVLNAQDSDIAWIKTLTIEPIPNLPNSFLVCYTAVTKKICLIVTVAKIDYEYYITDIVAR